MDAEIAASGFAMHSAYNLGSHLSDISRTGEADLSVYSGHMLQQLLADRFSLKAHIEPEILTLLVARNGPRMQTGDPPPPSPPGEQGPGPKPIENKVDRRGAEIDGHGATMDRLAKLIELWLARADRSDWAHRQTTYLRRPHKINGRVSTTGHIKRCRFKYTLIDLSRLLTRLVSKGPLPRSEAVITNSCPMFTGMVEVYDSERGEFEEWLEELSGWGPPDLARVLSTSELQLPMAEKSFF